jgi:hypothetical protein
MCLHLLGWYEALCGGDAHTSVHWSGKELWSFRLSGSDRAMVVTWDGPGGVHAASIEGDKVLDRFDFGLENNLVIHEVLSASTGHVLLS